MSTTSVYNLIKKCYDGHLHEAIGVSRSAIAPCDREAKTLAERIFNATATTLRARPPVGVDPAYIEGFMARNRTALLRAVAPHLG